MIKIKIRDEELIIDFEHQNFQQLQHESTLPIKKQNRLSGTSCIIKFNNNVLTEFAQLSLKDNFCKSKGRIVALKKALSKIFLNKEERGLVYKAYFEKCKI